MAVRTSKSREGPEMPMPKPIAAMNGNTAHVGIAPDESSNANPAPLANELYSDEFYGLCAQHLSPRGLMSLQVASPVLRPDIVVNVVQKLRRHFKVVAPYLVPTPHAGGVWMMISASQAEDPRRTTASTLSTRMLSRGIRDLQYYCPDTHVAMFAQPPFVDRLLQSA